MIHILQYLLYVYMFIAICLFGICSLGVANRSNMLSKFWLTDWFGLGRS